MRLNYLILLILVPWKQIHSVDLNSFLQCLEKRDSMETIQSDSLKLQKAQTQSADPFLWGLGMERETMSSSNYEETYMFSREFELPWKKKSRQQLELKQARKYELHQEQWSQRYRQEIKRKFYRALFFQERSNEIGKFVDTLKSMEKKIQDRVKHGESSQLDQLRLSQEGLKTEQDFIEANSRFKNLVQELFMLTQCAQKGQRLEGSLAPEGNSNSISGQNTSFLIREMELQEIQIQARQSGSGKLSSLELELGQKRVQSGLIEDRGWVAGIQAKFPVSSSQKREGQRLQKLYALEKSRLKEDQLRRKAEIESKKAELSLLKKRYQTSRKEMLPSSKRLLDLRQTSYFGGESTLVELLDSYKLVYENSLNQLEIAMNARNCLLELENLIWGLDE